MAGTVQWTLLALATTGEMVAARAHRCRSSLPDLVAPVSSCMGLTAARFSPTCLKSSMSRSWSRAVTTNLHFRRTTSMRASAVSLAVNSFSPGQENRRYKSRLYTQVQT
jgi:hypothetical protein